MDFYIYNTESMEVIAIAKGDTNIECEYKASYYLGCPAEFAGTYTPAFGTIDGLIDQPEVDIL